LSVQGRKLIEDWSSDRESGRAQLLGGISANQLSVFSRVLDKVLTRLRATYDPG
jgi:hypothetical protein